MQILSNRLDRAYNKHKEAYEQKALEVLRSGVYIMGPELSSFEKEFASYTGAEFCVGLASGLDSLRIAFRLLHIGAGDEVIVQGNTFIAAIMGISENGATPVFAEPDAHFALTAEAIEKRITSRTKAVLVTHLYGMMTPMDDIVALCKARRLRLVEDCAQAHGASYKGKKAGTFGDIGCFSFYPTKNLGAFGDGGAVLVHDETLAEQFRVFRNYGCVDKYHNAVVGVNSRLDELQAGLLRVRLRSLDADNLEKNTAAAYYSNHITNPQIVLPQPQNGTFNVWHQYVIRCEQRDALAAYLKANRIGTLIHYPIPPHLSEAYSYLGFGRGDLPATEHLADTVLSLPCYFGITQEEQRFVTEVLNSFSCRGKTK